MVVARNSDDFYRLARQFFRAWTVPEGVFAKYRYKYDDYVYKLVKEGTKRIFRMYWTDLITYDELEKTWRVERYPSITTVEKFNGVASEIGLPVRISENHFYVYVHYVDLNGEPTEFCYTLPSDIKVLKFKSNEDLAELVERLGLHPDWIEDKRETTRNKPRVLKGYVVKDPNNDYTSIDLYRVEFYEVSKMGAFIYYRGFQINSAHTHSLEWLEKLWITRFLQDRPIDKRILKLVDMIHEVRELSVPNRFVLRTKNFEIVVEVNSIANIT
ncbi:hypothetical protein DRO21_06155, partial [archaeon]